MNAYSESPCNHDQTTPGFPGVLVSAVTETTARLSTDCVRPVRAWVQDKTTSLPESAEPEHWRPIPGYDGYEASTWGRIRSVDRYLEVMGRWGLMRKFYPGKILRLKRKPNGAGLYNLCFYAGSGGDLQVNRAVCLAFHGAPPSDRHQAAHLDGKTANNRPENLAWKTPTENAADKVRHGTAPIGAKNAMARLNEARVADILRRYAAGEKSQCLADEFGVSFATVLAVARGDIWTHVQCAQRESAKRRCRQNMLEASGRANMQRRLHVQRQMAC
jgi:hypothetical protein